MMMKNVGIVTVQFMKKFLSIVIATLATKAIEI